METHGFESVLKNYVFFENFEAEGLALLAGCAKNMHIEAGQFLGREGAKADNFYLIRDGSVAVETHHPSKGNLILQTVNAGEVVGWSWIYPPYTWSFDVRALEKLHVLQFDGNCLRGKCEDNPRIGYTFMKSFAGIMTQRLKSTRLQLLNIYDQKSTGVAGDQV